MSDSDEADNERQRCLCIVRETINQARANKPLGWTIEVAALEHVERRIDSDYDPRKADT